MMNQLLIVGRIANDPELKTLESGKQVANITLAVPRSFKNADGVYETDFINTSVWESIASNVCDYCKKGDLVGIKGRLQTDTYEKDGKNITKLNLIAEQVTFLSSREQSSNENKEVEGR